MIKQFIFILFFISFIGNAIPCRAMVPPVYREVADKYGIDPQLLYAIALVESERSYQGMIGPWPWTLNISGKPFYFDSRQAAYDRLAIELQQHQNENIAIGPMQIYWRYNKRYFTDAWSALDPYQNIDVGAQILLFFSTQRGSMEEAVGAYYSPNKPHKAAQYQTKVRDKYQLVKRGQR